jgi:hypothetical protein
VVVNRTHALEARKDRSVYGGRDAGEDALGVYGHLH